MILFHLPISSNFVVYSYSLNFKAGQISAHQFPLHSYHHLICIPQILKPVQIKSHVLESTGFVLCGCQVIFSQQYTLSQFYFYPSFFLPPLFLPTAKLRTLAVTGRYHVLYTHFPPVLPCTQLVTLLLSPCSVRTKAFPFSVLSFIASYQNSG